MLCDTNIIIDLYKNVARIIDELKFIEEQNIAISVITASEMVYGAIDKRELKRILRDISHLRVLPLNEAIGNLQLQLLTKYSLSHSLDLPDALIAATSIYYDVPLFTLNRKDFRFIGEVQLYSPSWEK